MEAQSSNQVVFQPWPKIPRWNKQVWTITEKIDGTNACVIVPENKDAPVQAQSRTRLITPESDNYGFAKWVQANADKLRRLGPGHHFGEWWGSGIQRGYGLTNGEKRFSLFNAHRYNNHPGGLPDCCLVVPVLYCSNQTPDIEAVMERLKLSGSKAAPEFMSPEGIIIHVGGNIYKKTFRDEHKGE